MAKTKQAKIQGHEELRILATAGGHEYVVSRKGRYAAPLTGKINPTTGTYTWDDADARGHTVDRCLAADDYRVRGAGPVFQEVHRLLNELASVRAAKVRVLEMRRVRDADPETWYGWEIGEFDRPVYWCRTPTIPEDEVACIGIEHASREPDVVITVHGTPGKDLLTHYWREDPKGEAMSLSYRATH